jgi:hypothetical protein
VAFSQVRGTQHCWPDEKNVASLLPTAATTTILRDQVLLLAPSCSINDINDASLLSPTSKEDLPCGHRRQCLVPGNLWHRSYFDSTVLLVPITLLRVALMKTEDVTVA